MENFLYNPDQKNKNQLKEEFVVRTEVLADIMADLENSDMSKPEQHYLLVGQRGTGKTTMLLRLRYAIEDSKKLSKWLIPVSFNEEQYNVTELANLWISIAEYLEDNHGFEGLADSMEDSYGSTDFEEKCYEILEKALKDHDKKIILLIDNIGDLFKKFDKMEVHRLREILQTKKYLRLIAGTPFYLDTVLDYTQPFFEFFKVKRLDGLNEEEARTLLRKLGDIYGQSEKIERIITETPQRIETLRILTSGVPRTITLLFQIFIDHEHESSMKDLMRVLDVVTPLYKHRMDDLPTQQQKIVDAVARNWDAITVKELRERIKLDSKVISAQLRQLEKNQVIEKRETGTKNHMYLLQDRFWNIWYLMRNGRKRESDRVVWLVKFLESWCSNDDFEKRIATYVNQIKEGKLDENTKELYAQVYSSLRTLTSRQKFLLKDNVDKNIASRIYITEEDAVEEARILSAEDRHLEAISALIQSDILSNEGKNLISKYVEELYIGKNAEFAEQIIKDRYIEFKKKPGYITVVLRAMQMSISFAFIRKNLDDVYSMIDLIPNILDSIDKPIEDYEIKILHDIAALCLLHKQFKLLNVYFEKLDYLNFKEQYKLLYIICQYYLNNSNSAIINAYGAEIQEPIHDILKFLEGYWVNEKFKVSQ